MAAGKNPHAGHRERVKEEYRKEGLDHLSYHRVLELLLYFGIPQKDTNELAHLLIETFGSFSQVFSADIEALAAVPNMTKNAATLIHLVPDVFRRIAEDEMDREWVLNTDELMAEYLKKRFYGRSKETFMLLCLSNSCRLLRCDVLSEGDSAGTSVDVRALCEIVLRCNCHHIVVAHNHPGGSARPSNQDISFTNSLVSTLRMLDIRVLDHFILAGETYSSMASLGYLGVDRVRLDSAF